MVSGGKMEFGRWKLGVQGSGLSGAGFSLSMDDRSVIGFIARRGRSARVEEHHSRVESRGSRVERHTRVNGNGLFDLLVIDEEAIE